MIVMIFSGLSGFQYSPLWPREPQKGRKIIIKQLCSDSGLLYGFDPARTPKKNISQTDKIVKKVRIKTFFLIKI